MKLAKVVRVREQIRKKAAAKFAAAHGAVEEAEDQLQQITELGEAYARKIETSVSAYQLRQRAMFITKLRESLDLQDRRTQELRKHLHQCQIELARCRADENLLLDLVMKREAVLTRRMLKKQERGQVYRSKTKL